MNVVEKQVRVLVCAEAMTATHNYGPIHSQHEGWAVLKEEVDEADFELAMVQGNIEELWERVKRNFDKNDNLIRDTKEHAIALACEAIQCAAVCKRIAEMEGKSCENH